MKANGGCRSAAFLALFALIRAAAGFTTSLMSSPASSHASVSRTPPQRHSTKTGRRSCSMSE
ncbi:unnamed protein product, partial [Ectocarpus sp. 12 AP-2014]